MRSGVDAVWSNCVKIRAGRPKSFCRLRGFISDGLCVDRRDFLKLLLQAAEQKIEQAFGGSHPWRGNDADERDSSGGHHAASQPRMI